MTGRNIPQKAFILAAGFGTRLRPYTHDRPKPMVEVNGRSLLWRTLDKLQMSGVREVVVNVHYKANMIVEHVAAYMAQNHNMTVHVSVENTILDTGGGVKHALHYFEDDPFYVIAGDNLWCDGAAPALERLAAAWDPDSMDIVTLMQPLEQMVLTEGVGDYDIAQDGRAHRSRDKTGGWMWTNIRLNHPRIYRDWPVPCGAAFSFLDVMDACEEHKRLFALVHDGVWHHISTPDDLKRVDTALRNEEEGSAA